MSGQALALRNAIAAGLVADTGLQALLDRPVSVTVHGGDFTREDLQRYAKNAPAVIVATLRVDAKHVPPAILASCHMTAIVVTKPLKGEEKGAQALDIVDTLIRLVMRSVWLDASGCSRPKNATSKNLFTPDIDAMGVAMWAVTWLQEIDLAEVDGSVPFETFTADWDVYPRDNDAALGDVIEAQDEVTIVQD